MTTKKRASQKTIGPAKLAAIRRVLVLLDGYMSHQDQHVVLGHDGGMMTIGELREHAQAAVALIDALRSGGR